MQLDSSGSGCGKVFSCCEHDNTPWLPQDKGKSFRGWETTSFSVRIVLHPVAQLDIAHSFHSVSASLNENWTGSIQHSVTCSWRPRLKMDRPDQSFRWCDEVRHNLACWRQQDTCQCTAQWMNTQTYDCVKLTVLLDAFAKLRKANISFIMSVHLSNCPHRTIWVPLDGCMHVSYSVHFILNFMFSSNIFPLFRSELTF